MILFFDTETTGKWDFNKPDTHPAQPNLVQLACMLTTDEGRALSSFCFVVKPDAWTIPPESSLIHKIPHELAMQVGLPLVTVCRAFYSLASRAHSIVCHNYDFDSRVIGAAFARCVAAGAMEKTEPLENNVRRICTMKAATPIAKIPHARPFRADDWKWPSLGECYAKFFGGTLDGAHDAMIDVQACARVYFYMEKLKKEEASGARPEGAPDKAAAVVAALTLLEAYLLEEGTANRRQERSQ